ncbi:nucleotide exchange factor GrpE [bacterium]|nr:nucleotide exchange factor GrpE [bacterium]MBU1072907.1 nucleotide exchange factor GrpE [bacterium]MBU1674857.1 nucleotide exchange factor GrpE [bacterium]
MTKKKKAEQKAEAPEQRVAAEAEVDTDDAAVVHPANGAAAPGDESSAEELLTRERDDLKDKWLRAVAEQDNVRKRTRREVGDAYRFAVADLVRELLEVLDNFERAAASAAAGGESGEEPRGLRSGFELIHVRFREILEGRGLEAVPADKGQSFDPSIHEAVLRIESDDVASGEIVDVAQAGYRLNDLVLRPARVVVAQ